jgi:hypothetical protein
MMDFAGFGRGQGTESMVPELNGKKVALSSHNFGFLCLCSQRANKPVQSTVAEHGEVP